MPITDYQFQDHIFFCKESGLVSIEDAEAWATKLKDTIRTSNAPVVAVVDAIETTFVARQAEQIFKECSYFENLRAIIVAANAQAYLQSEVIGLLGKQGVTRMVRSVEEAFAIAQRMTV